MRKISRRDDPLAFGERTYICAHSGCNSRLTIDTLDDITKAGWLEFDFARKAVCPAHWSAEQARSTHAIA